jgi:hypothetical protein
MVGQSANKTNTKEERGQERRLSIPDVYLVNWLQVLGATELAQIDQRVRHQFHAIVPLLDAFKAEQESL